MLDTCSLTVNDFFRIPVVHWFVAPLVIWVPNKRTETLPKPQEFMSWGRLNYQKLQLHAAKKYKRAWIDMIEVSWFPFVGKSPLLNLPSDRPAPTPPSDESSKSTTTVWFSKATFTYFPRSPASDKDLQRKKRSTQYPLSEIVNGY